jgi:hypothetical protein
MSNKEIGAGHAICTSDIEKINLRNGRIRTGGNCENFLIASPLGRVGRDSTYHLKGIIQNLQVVLKNSLIK